MVKKEAAEPKHKFNTSDLPDKTVIVRPVPYFAFVSDDPNFVALTFTGKTPEDAFRTALSHATVYYKHQFNVNVVIEDE